MKRNLFDLSYKELIEIIINSAGSNEATAAKEIIDLKKYEMNLRLNKIITWLTIVIAFSTLFQLISDYLHNECFNFLKIKELIFFYCKIY